MKRLPLFVIILFCCTHLPAQTLSDGITKRIDSLFSKWNSSKSPGTVIGIIRNDSLVYAKGYGMANLEYDIPNSPETIFHMASVSKQFTAYAIVLLARQGRLNLDDDIHKYLPWVPDFKEKITIRHLLNHTSGITGSMAIDGYFRNQAGRCDHTGTYRQNIEQTTGTEFKTGGYLQLLQ